MRMKTYQTTFQLKLFTCYFLSVPFERHRLISIHPRLATSRLGQSLLLFYSLSIRSDIFSSVVERIFGIRSRTVYEKHLVNFLLSVYHDSPDSLKYRENLLKVQKFPYQCSTAENSSSV